MSWICPICKIELTDGYNRRFTKKHLLKKHNMQTTNWTNEELKSYGGMIKKDSYFKKKINE